MVNKEQENRLKESKKRLAISKEKYKNHLRTLPLTELQAEIITELNKRPAGERSIYIESGKPIRKELGGLMDAGYIDRGKDNKYFLNEDGHKKLRWAEIGIAKTARNLLKKKKQEKKDTLRKWKEELPKLEKKKEEKNKKLMSMYDSVSPETKKAYRNNKYLWKGHSKWIETKDEKGLRTMKAIDEYKHRIAKNSNKMYRLKGAIEKIEKELKGKLTKRDWGKLKIELEWEKQSRRNLDAKLERVHKKFERSIETKKPHVLSDLRKYNIKRTENLNKKMYELKDLYDKEKNPKSQSVIMNEIKKIKKSLQHK